MEFRQIQLFMVFNALCLLYKCSGSDDYYTSPVGVQKLIKAEQKILTAASEYAAILENRINIVKRYLQDYEDSVVSRMQPSALPDKKKGETTVKIYDKESDLLELGEKVASHPLITYRLIRRFALELNDLEKDVSNNDEKKFLVELEKVRKGLSMPKFDDVNGAIEGLLRVQDAYELNVTEFSQGNFMGLETNSGLTAADCYQIGLYALQSHIYIRAVEWLERAYLMSTLENDESIDTVKVKKGLEEAIYQHDQAHKRNPQHLYVFHKTIESISGTGGINATLRQAFADRKHILYQEFDSVMDLWNFAALCSGKILQSKSLSKDFACSYKITDNIPILVEKVEWLSLDPPVIQVYDVISDTVIERLLARAAPFMSRSKVQGNAEKREVASVVRTSTTTWIPESSDPILAKIPHRIRAITGLNIVQHGAAEDLQVSSYGIGGHYNPHFDTILDPKFVATSSKEELDRGDRIATFMFYLTTLEKGGGTAFPRLTDNEYRVHLDWAYLPSLSKDQVFSGSISEEMGCVTPSAYTVDAQFFMEQSMWQINGLGRMLKCLPESAPYNLERKNRVKEPEFIIKQNTSILFPSYYLKS